MVQRLKICLPVQGTQARSLVREDPKCRGATKPVHHNFWACALQPACRNYWARVLQLPKPKHLEPLLRNKREATAMRSPRTATKSSPCSPQVEKAHAQQRRPKADKEKKKEKKITQTLALWIHFYLCNFPHSILWGRNSCPIEMPPYSSLWNLHLLFIGFK